MSLKGAHFSLGPLRMTQECKALLCTKCRAKAHTAHSGLPTSEVAFAYKMKLERLLGGLEKG
jgi:hypothetical protein